MAEAVQSEKIPAGPQEGHRESSELKFEPLGMMPADIQPRWRAMAEKLASRAATSYRSAVKLKCLDCTAWYPAEAAKCQINECPLWAHNQTIFKRWS